jgi:hypothetical protein
MNIVVVLEKRVLFGNQVDSHFTHKKDRIELK